jgi:hypothetical protein
MLGANADRTWSRAADLMETLLPSRCVGLIGHEVEDIRGWAGDIDPRLKAELPHNASFWSFDHH